MKKDHQIGGPGTFYKGLLDDHGWDMNSPVRKRRKPLFHSPVKRKPLDHRAMASFLREHPELLDKDHGRIKDALVQAKLCYFDTDIVKLDVNWIVAKAKDKLESWREPHH